MILLLHAAVMLKCAFTIAMVNTHIVQLLAVVSSSVRMVTVSGIVVHLSMVIAQI